jgi:hypothetical protein
LSVLVAACSDPNTTTTPAPAPAPKPIVTPTPTKPRCAPDAPIVYESRSIGRGADTSGYTLFSPQSLTVREGGAWTYKIQSLSHTGCLAEADEAKLVAALDRASFVVPESTCERKIHVEHVVRDGRDSARTLTFHTFSDGTVKPCGMPVPDSLRDVMTLLDAMIEIPAIPA